MSDEFAMGSASLVRAGIIKLKALMSKLDNARLVEVYAAGDVVEAHLVCTLLDDAGIHARVVGDALGLVGGGIPFGSPTSPRIWVFRDCEVEARKLIEQWETDRRGGK